MRKKAKGRVVKAYIKAASSSSSSKAVFWCFIEGEGGEALFGDFLIFGDFSRGRAGRFLMDFQRGPFF
jgi:hypothetical protein